MKRRQWLAAATLAGTALARATTDGVRGARRLGVALGSGAAHGMAHVGVVRAFERYGLKPDVIAGTSVGAIVGALWAGGADAETIEQRARGFDWNEATRFAWPLRGLLRNDGLQQMIDEALARRPIEQLPIPFAALATDVANGAPVVLRRGPTGVAVAASSAIPVIFEPVPLNGRSLVDGSLCQPVPIDAARELGADLVLAVDVAYRPSDAPVRGLIDMPFQMMHIMINALITEQIARADLRIQLDLHRLMLDTSDPAPLIRAGEEAVERIWPELQRLLRA